MVLGTLVLVAAHAAASITPPRRRVDRCAWRRRASSGAASTRGQARQQSVRARGQRKAKLSMCFSRSNPTIQVPQRSVSWGKSTGLRAEPSGAEQGRASRAEPSGAEGAEPSGAQRTAETTSQSNGCEQWPPDLGRDLYDLLLAFTHTHTTQLESARASCCWSAMAEIS